MTTKEKIYQLTENLLQADNDDYKTLLESSTALYTTLKELVGMDESSDMNRDNYESENGIAIGSTWAAMCINDLLRTKKFIDGVFKAVQDIKKKNLSRPVQILYTGTGPFATLILPLFTRFTSNDLQFTLLEINKPSYEFLLKMIDRLEVQEYIRLCLNEDASMYSIPREYAPDIFICETMQQALAKEPQVAINLNIVPQLPTDCIVIPGRIVLLSAFVNESEWMQSKMQPQPIAINNWKYQTNVFELSKNSILTYRNNKQPGAWPLSDIKYDYEKMKQFPALYILTVIHIYDGVTLSPDECALTLPLKLNDFSEYSNDAIVSLRYVTGANPGLQISITNC